MEMGRVCPSVARRTPSHGLASYSAPSNDLGEDHMYWRHSKNGENRRIMLKVTWAIKVRRQLAPPWKLVCVRVKIFIWLLVHNRLMTNERRNKRHMVNDPCCHHCPAVVELTMHVLRNCHDAREV